MQDSNPGIDAEKDDTRTRLIGADDREATIRIDTPSSESKPSPAPEPGGTTPRRGKMWIYVVIALVVIAAGAVAAFLLLGDDDKNDSKSLSSIEADEVPGVNDADMGDFLNAAMGARYDKSADDTQVAAADSAAEDIVAVDSVAAW